MKRPPLHTRSRHEADTAIPRKGEITRGDLKRNWPHHVCAASSNVGLPTRYRKKVLLTMGFAL
jgi:hypothetical protein